MNTHSRSLEVGGRALRWTGRLTGLASVGILALFMIGEGFDPTRLRGTEALLHVFFPFGLILGLVLGWRRELLGGSIALLGLAGFYALHLVFSGRFPRGWAFAVLASPALVLLASAFVHRLAGQRRPLTFAAKGGCL